MKGGQSTTEYLALTLLVATGVALFGPVLWGLWAELVEPLTAGLETVRTLPMAAP